jgi:hypothetical protein
LAFRAQPVAEEKLNLRFEEAAFRHGLNMPVQIVLGGSAGGGVQSAANIFTQAAVRSGLHFSLKSDYPVTVGKGHSTCEIILSPQPILFSGISRPDLAIVCSEDGRRALGGLIPAAKEVMFNAPLAMHTGAPVDLQLHGHRNSAFYALAMMLNRHGWFPILALRQVISELDNEQRKRTLLGILERGLDDGAVL